MSGLDAGALIIIGVSAFFGLSRGLVKEVLSVVVWLIAGLIAAHYYPTLSGLFSSLSSATTVMHTLSFIAIFLVVLLAGGFLSGFVSGAVNLSGLAIMNMSLGAAFGAVRGFLICMLLVSVGDMTGYASSAEWTDSLVVPFVQESTHWLWGNLMTISPDSKALNDLSSLARQTL